MEDNNERILNDNNNNNMEGIVNINTNIETENNYVYCADCGAQINIYNDDHIQLENGDYICGDCLDKNYFYCEDCESYHHNDECYEIYRHGGGSFYVCEDCKDNYYYCEDCGYYYEDDDCGRYVDGVWYCNDCLDERFGYCSNCGEYFDPNNMYWDEETEEYYCEDCYNEIVSSRGEILDYHEHVTWELFKSNSENENEIPYYIGTENEVVPKYGNTDNQHEALETIKNNINAVAMHDGSLDSGGFEIISHPQTFKYIMEHKESIKKTWDKLIELGYISHDSDCCGLHFHVTRPHDPDILDRLWLILETYKDEIIKLSRRGGITRWAKWLSDEVVSSDNKNKLKALYFIKKTNKNSTRYMALNNTNEKTIEFRFFKGTLKFETYMADVEFINNLMTLCSNTNIKIKDITWKKLTTGEFITPYVNEHDIKTDKIPVDNSLLLIRKENKQKMTAQKLMNLYFRILKRAIKNINLKNIKSNNIDRLYIDISAKSNDIYNVKDIVETLQILNNRIDNFNNISIKSWIYSINDLKDRFIVINTATKEENEKIQEYINNIIKLEEEVA